MRFRLRPVAVAAALATPALAIGQTPPVKPAPAAGPSSPPSPEVVVVTANPLRSALFELVPPVSVMQGQGLRLRKRSTLGETVNDLPGVSSTYYGPNASRPVIRGLDGDRIRILDNGAGTLDASSVSFDHAVAIDPMLVERVEVVRGPAALLYGGSAVGGVVNVIDSRIPKSPVDGVTGSVEGRIGGAERQRGAGAVLEAGNGAFTLHADAYTRRTEDLQIRGPAVSGRLRALANSGARMVPQALLDAVGRLPNSDARSNGGALGGAAFWEQGSFGLSYSSFDSRYGTVAKPTVRINMKSDRLDLAGELRDLGGFLSGVKFRHALTDYGHREIDAGVVGTTFQNKGYETRLEAVHRPLASVSGSFGLQINSSDFSAVGAEAFVPKTNTGTKAAFLYEELPLGRLKLSAGARVERSVARSEGGGAVPFGDTAPRFGAAQTRSFSPGSASAGALYSFTPGLALAVNAALTQRAPTASELFANGPHAATGVFEIGNRNFDKERSRSIDAALRGRTGADTWSVGVFYSRFRNFIAEFRTGNNRGADGELNPPDDGEGNSSNTGKEILPEVAFRAVPAVFRGFEAQARFRLAQGPQGSWDLELRGDYTRAHDRSTGTPLPRIAPLRFGAGISYALAGWTARLDATRVQAQGRVSANELPTDRYTLLNASAGYRFGRNVEGFLRADNLGNVGARNHTSFLKDIAPLPGRGVTIGLRAGF